MAAEWAIDRTLPALSGSFSSNLYRGIEIKITAPCTLRQIAYHTGIAGGSAAYEIRKGTNGASAPALSSYTTVLDSGSIVPAAAAWVDEDVTDAPLVANDWITVMFESSGYSYAALASFTLNTNFGTVQGGAYRTSAGAGVPQVRDSTVYGVANAELDDPATGGAASRRMLILS